MNKDELLEKIGKLLDTKLEAERKYTKGLLEAEREQTRKVVREEVQAAEQRLTKKIEVSQEDTINTLSEVIQTGYSMQDERIRAIEEHLDIPHPKEN